MTADLEPGHRRPEGADQREIPPLPDRPRRRGPGAGSDNDADPTRLAWLVAGAAAIAAGTALGWDSTALASVVTPPPIIRAALVGGSFALGVVLLISALGRLAGEPLEGPLPPTARERQRDIVGMIRGVRLVFLAVAAFAAASGWAVGHPLPLVVALVIAGVDVLETSFLLVVVTLRSRD
jgi:ribose/xylose/arabinose/galactoside ABC-type transport system permease subunit